MVGSSLKPSCGRHVTPIHSIPYSVAHLWREVYKYYSYIIRGTLINVNIVDKYVLLEAHRDPTTHPDLVVRVTGFTAYFATLSPEFRQLVIDRVVSDR